MRALMRALIEMRSGDVGLKRIRVLTNHPEKVVALEGYGLEIEEQVALAGEVREKKKV